MVMPMPEKRNAEVERPDPQAEGRSGRSSKYNKRECCGCERSADLFHDAAPEMREKISAY
jgi:hypothetical protein